MARTTTAKPGAAGTFKERYAVGKFLRATCPRDAHASWKPPAGRMPALLPLRHGRMVRSPFNCYRVSALAIATDLASTPSASRFDVTSDGRRFLFVRPAGRTGGAPQRLVLVENWRAELQRVEAR
jgi:hypothetical protein